MMKFAHIRQLSSTLLVTALIVLAAAYANAISAQTEPTATPQPTESATPQPTQTATGEPPEMPDGSELPSSLSDVAWADAVELALSTLVIVLVAIYGGRLVFALLEKGVRRTTSDIDEGMLDAIKPQISWFIAALGFQFATARLDFLSDGVKEFLQTVYFSLYLFVIVASMWRLGDFWLDRYLETHAEDMNANLVHQVFPLLKRLFHLMLALLSGGILAAYLGINLFAVSAALGLSGFAIALSAKDTISNIISGMVIMIAQPFKIGDRVDVDGLGSWGDVVEIGIRSTKVLMRDNRLVIVPNSGIVDNAVVNYSMPDKTYRLQSDIGIGYEVDIPEVQRLIRAAVRQVEGVLPEKPVDVWFTEFGVGSNTFRVRWWVATYSDKRRVTHEVNRAIQELSDQGQLLMPNPTYSIDNELAFDDDSLQGIAKAVRALN